MNHLQNRIERLEQRGDSEMNLLVVIGEPSAEQQQMIEQDRIRIGEPSAEQQQMIEQDRIRTVVQMPDNGRGDDGSDQNKA